MVHIDTLKVVNKQPEYTHTYTLKVINKQPVYAHTHTHTHIEVVNNQCTH